MKVKSAEFIKGIVGEDDLLHNGTPQVAFIGRSNVGKSSVINSLTRPDLARASAVPGKTKEINMYLINKDFYLADLPGYGFAENSLENRDILKQLIWWYLLFSNIKHKIIVMIIDAEVGPTKQDLTMIRRMTERQKKIIIVANKIDKIKKSGYKQQMEKIQTQVGRHKIIAFSAKEKIGVEELFEAISK